MKKWLCVIWCLIGAPISFLICWVYDFALGGAYTSFIGLIGGGFLLLSAILLVFNKYALAKGLGFLGCGINLAAYIIVCAIGKDLTFSSCLIALLWYSIVTIIPFFLLLKVKDA